MKEQFSRTAMLISEKGVKAFNNSKIIVFGVGGVGSYTVEALARLGFARIDVCDADTVSLSNINRQIIALHSTLGRKKVEVIKERIVDICPETEVDTFDFFFDEKTASKIDFSKYDYIIDAIDSTESKVLLIKKAKELNIPIISSLGTGNKIDPTKFLVTDIYKTNTCPVAKILRKRLKEEGIGSLNVLFSDETPIDPDPSYLTDVKKRTVGSISFVPSSAGLVIASFVAKDILKRSYDELS